jgi:hypothetical protein
LAHYFGMNGGAAGVAILMSSLATMTFADAPAATPPSTGNLDSDIAMILDNTLPETAYSEKRRCLTRNAYRSVEVIDTGHLLFWGSGGRVWLNQLRPPCIGLARDQILKFQMNGPSLCELDRFEGFERYGQAGGIIAICGLQRFEVISQEQAKQLRDMLRRRAHSAAASVPPPPQPETKPESKPGSLPESPHE